MIYGSVCSGIESATLAWHHLGWRPRWFAETAAFPSAVLARRWPEVPNVGDFTAIESRHGPIDLLVGGTPCQSFSTAGNRLGLADPRGNLTLEFFALARRLRPRWLVWENVPGILADDRGRTWGAIIGIMAQLGYRWAARVLDAIHFGIPQMRRRVFVVGHLGEWAAPWAVLLEPHCLRGDDAPLGSARPDNAVVVASDSDGGGVSRALNAKGGAGRFCPGSETFVASTPVWFSCRDYAQDLRVDAAPTLKAMNEIDGNPNGGGQVAVAFKPSHYTRGKDGAPKPAVPTLAPEQDRGDQEAIVAQTGAPWVRRLTPLECERLQGLPDWHTMVAGRARRIGAPEAAYLAHHRPAGIRVWRDAGGHWTDAAADGPRYKAIGNAMAVPVMRWIGERIAAADAALKEAA